MISLVESEIAQIQAQTKADLLRQIEQLREQALEACDENIRLSVALANARQEFLAVAEVLRHYGAGGSFDDGARAREALSRPVFMNLLRLAK